MRNPGRRRRELRSDRQRLRERGNPRPPALLAGCDRDAAPVRELAFARVAIEAHDAARSRDRHDRRDAELGRFLHHEVHALGARDALHQRDRQRRLRPRDSATLDRDLDRAATDAGNARRVVLAVAVEERERVARFEPKHALRVGCGGAA